MAAFRLQACTVLACAAIFFAPTALSHITLETPQAAAGARYKAVLRVSHGCQGSATVKLRVQIPDGFIGVKPQPKAGWQVGIVKGDYDRPYMLHGASLTAGVQEIDWAGGPLPDDFYDEFVFMGYLSNGLKPGTTLYFPVIQECERGVERWIDVPDDAGDAHGHGHDAGAPAPGLKVLPQG